MPSQKPRVALTIPDDLNEVLQDLSDLNEVPKSKLIVELLVQMQPILSAQRDALESVKKGVTPEQALLAMLGTGFGELGQIATQFKRTFNDRLDYSQVALSP
jgi:hypothetical protein